VTIGRGLQRRHDVTRQADQDRDGIAGQREDRGAAVIDAEPQRPARALRHLMKDAPHAEFVEHRRHVIEAAGGNAAAQHQHVVAAEFLREAFDQNRPLVRQVQVAHRRESRKPQCGSQRVGVRTPHLVGQYRQARFDQLIARGNYGDARQTRDLELRKSRRRGDREFRTAEARAGRQDQIAGARIGCAAVNVEPGFGRVAVLDGGTAGRNADALDGHDRVATRRQRCAGHHFDAVGWRSKRDWCLAGGLQSRDPELPPAGAKRRDRECDAVHRHAVEWRGIAFGKDFLAQDPACAGRQR
jgi:hypothetical protein